MVIEADGIEGAGHERLGVRVFVCALEQADSCIDRAGDIVGLFPGDRGIPAYYIY